MLSNVSDKIPAMNTCCMSTVFPMPPDLFYEVLGSQLVHASPKLAGGVESMAVAYGWIEARRDINAQVRQVSLAGEEGAFMTALTMAANAHAR